MRHTSAAAEMEPWRLTSTSSRRRLGSSASTMPSGKGIYAIAPLAAYAAPAIRSLTTGPPDDVLAPGERMRRMMNPTAAPVDVNVLRGEIRKTYTEVSTHPEKDFIFP